MVSIAKFSGYNEIRIDCSSFTLSHALIIVLYSGHVVDEIGSLHQDK